MLAGDREDRVPIVPEQVTANQISSEAIQSLSMECTVELLPPVACDTAAAQSGEAHFPADEWKKSRVHAWLVDAPSECARDLVRELGTASIDGTLALTLDAAGSNAHAPGLKEVAVRAGEIPVVAPPRPDGVDRRLRTCGPGIRCARGAAELVGPRLDTSAAILARRAVATLPLDATSDAAEVTKRCARPRKGALLGAKATAHLWTSESRGVRRDARAPRASSTRRAGGIDEGKCPAEPHFVRAARAAPRVAKPPTLFSGIDLRWPVVPAAANASPWSVPSCRRAHAPLLTRAKPSLGCARAGTPMGRFPVIFRRFARALRAIPRAPRGAT